VSSSCDRYADQIEGGRQKTEPCVVEDVGDWKSSCSAKRPPGGARAVAAAGAATTITGNGDWLMSAKSRGFKPSQK